MYIELAILQNVHTEQADKKKIDVGQVPAKLNDYSSNFSAAPSSVCLDVVDL